MSRNWAAEAVSVVPVFFRGHINGNFTVGK